MSQALDNLNGGVSALTASVDRAITIIQTPPPASGVPEADVQAAADKIVALNTKLTGSLPQS